MSVNTRIYGTPEQWGIANLGTSQNHADRKDSFLTAHFGGGGNTLENGYGYGINLNTPIDKSLSYCGLGGFSTWSKIEYYKRNRDLELIGKDSRSVTNFSFNQAVKISIMTGIWYAENTSWSNTRYGSRCRFAPNAINSSAQENYNNGFIPIVQIPIKNCVLVPIFRVAKQINTDGTTTGMDVATISCWDYYGTTATRNHTTHPYILGIGFSFYTKTTDSASQRTSVSSSNSAILDEIALYKDVPVDLQRPDQSILSGGYSYCWNVPQSTFSYKHIFGYVTNGSSSVSNAIDYRVNDLPSSTRTDLLKAVAVFPHERAVFSDEWAVNTTTYARYYYLQYYDNGPEDNLREWVRKQLACFGLFFTDVSAAVAQSGAFDSDDMFLGVLDDNNIGQGVYTHGDDNRNQKQWDWETTNDSDYDPSGGGSDTDPNSYDGSMRTHDLSLLDTATQRYALSPTAMVGLLDKLWSIMDQASPDQALTDYSVGEFLATNPIDCIVSLQFVPVSNINTGTLTTVKLGRHDTEISCQTAKLALKVDCGNYEIFPRFGNNWIDRMTKITLYLPFCGTVNLDPEVYMGRKINVEYLIDLSNGTCTAIVSFVGDGGLKVITDTASGSCAMDLPVTGIQQQTLNSQLFNASESVKQLKVNNAFKGFNSIVNGAMSLGSNNPANTISGILGAGQDIYNIFQSEKIADYNLQHTMIPTKMIGTSGGLTGAMLEYYPTIIFERPSLPEGFDDLGRSEQYAHSEGYACCISGSLSEFTGYTEILNVDLAGFDATITEKNMIRSVLAGGVYL